ncbi:Oidioi.mRNA.OKI2018_I69.PAR.g11929.t1.cds [Oikopleura dioica]|uniref:non-specific serine/threonine protein kinase n=1 Tax=Oikopleura dioica TaxID=34765 RepID=A0ABN7RXY6_OIKDI|nr:Oidioi.mRNA.OKI2018_I69.PAR.g11929.t1.cds [Oikopleura dioica]
MDRGTWNKRVRYQGGPNRSQPSSSTTRPLVNTAGPSRPSSHTTPGSSTATAPPQRRVPPASARPFVPKDRPRQWASSIRSEAGSAASSSNSDTLIPKQAPLSKAAQIRKFLESRGIIIENTRKSLGEGSFSKVYKAVRNRTSEMGDVKTPVAVKIIDRANLAENMREHFLPRELEIIRAVRHSNICRLHFIMSMTDKNTDKIFIISDLYGGGDLLDYIMAKGKFSEPRCRKLFKDITRAVAYLHKNGIAHRDLKGENVLLRFNEKEKPDKAVITDFGFARRVDPQTRSSTFCGSTAYVPPEILENTPYHPFISDCWSLGVILYIMICAFMPYDTKDTRKMIKCQRGKMNFYHMQGQIMPVIENLICRLMNPDINTRITAEKALESPWLNGVRPPRAKRPRIENATNNIQIG